MSNVIDGYYHYYSNNAEGVDIIELQYQAFISSIMTGHLSIKNWMHITQLYTTVCTKLKITVF